MARRRRPGAPAEPRLYRGDVLSSTRISPNWQRVTVGGPDLTTFPWQGADHWFRLFVPRPGQAGLALPELNGAEWWHPYLALPDEVRPHCANYTVADCRIDDGELDVDFVLHRDKSGELEGEAAVWASRAAPGEPVAVLDQGTIFDPPDDADSFILVSDETGLPGMRNILKGLPRDAVGRVIMEVPTAADRGILEPPDGIEVLWIDRSQHADARPGSLALTELSTMTGCDVGGYGYVVGESTLATGARRLLHKLGLPKSRITFSGYWRLDPPGDDDS